MLMLIGINKFGMMWDLDHADVDPDKLKFGMMLFNVNIS